MGNRLDWVETAGYAGVEPISQSATANARACRVSSCHNLRMGLCRRIAFSTKYDDEFDVLCLILKPWDITKTTPRAAAS